MYLLQCWRTDEISGMGLDHNFGPPHVAQVRRSFALQYEADEQKAE